MGWIKVTRAPGPTWVNIDHIIRVGSSGQGGAMIYTTATDEKGTSYIAVRESLDEVMRLIQGTGAELVQPMP